MTDIVVTAAKVAPIDRAQCEIRTYLAAATITAGAALYITTSGTVGLASGDGSIQFRGIALNGGAAGQAIDVLHEGLCAGFTLTQNADTRVYLSDTNTGILADSNGSTAVVVGRCVCLPDKDATKVLRVTTRWSEDWA